jgi:hypothetical protein
MMAKAFRCMDCRKLFKKLEQAEDEKGQLMVTGFCEDCYCYTSRPVETDEDEEREIDETE